jgi:hypothetical protein
MKTRVIIPLCLVVLVIISCGKGGDGDLPTTSTETPVITTPYVPNPGKSSLSLPSNNEVCYDGTPDGSQNSFVNFSWVSSTDTDSYDLIIINQDTNRSQTESGITTTSQQVSLEKEVSYGWSIVSRAQGTSVTSISDTWQFYLQGDGEENNAPFPATLISPRSGSTITSSQTIILVWEGNDPDQNDILLYTVYIDNIDGLQDQTNSEYIDISSTTLTVDIENNTTYYWRIKTSDGISSSFTQVYSFRTN